MRRFFVSVYVSWQTQRGDTCCSVPEAVFREVIVGVNALVAAEAIEIACSNLRELYGQRSDIEVRHDRLYVGPADGPLADWAIERWPNW